MTSQEAAHRRNQESALLFMQQEHANTLKGLHDEIRKLQKKCSDLMFQLNMQGLGLDDAVSNAKVDELQSEVEEGMQRQNDMEKELESKQQLIRDLELQQKKHKMKHMEESRRKSQEVDKLKAELESKSNQVAYLTSELLKHKRLQAETNSDAVPVPPQSQHPSRTNRGGLGRHGKHSIDASELERRGIRGTSGKSNSSSRSDSPIEMAKPFLRLDDAEVHEVQLKESMRFPLPPIRSLTGKEGLTKQRVLVRKVVPPPHPLAHKHGSRSNVKTRELHLLAVDQVSGNEAAKWARPQESHSSEYN